MLVLQSDHRPAVGTEKSGPNLPQSNLPGPGVGKGNGGGDFQSQRAFAKASGLSHARVSQVLGLLRLCPSARDALDALGDPLYSRKVTERKLRPIVNLSDSAQVQRLKLLLRAYVIYKKHPAS